MSSYFRAIAQNKAAVGRVQSDAEHAIHGAYISVRARLAGPLDDFVGRYRGALSQAQSQAADESAGPVRVSPSWAHDLRGGNLPMLTAHVTAEVRAFGRAAYGVTATAKQEVGALGSEGAHAAMQAAVAPIAHLLPPRVFRMPHDAGIRAFVERAKDGGPLAKLFDGFGPDEAEALRNTIVGGLAGGISPRQLARELSQTLDKLTYGRAVTITRTETIHAWQGAALENYRANADVVSQWVWMADKGPNTCAACLAMDGQTFDLDTDLDDHPNGRCAKGPVTRGYGDILASFGIDSGDTFPPAPWETYQSGSDWLAEQSAETQRAVFGSASAYNAYASGDASLSDFAAVRHDHEWGDSIQQASLKSMGLDASDYASAS